MYYKILGLIILVILIYIIFNLREGFDVSGTSTLTPQSNEAIQNIAKIYADASGTVTFNNVNIIGNLNVIPRGCIMAFNSETAPTGWAVCDGTNGTPDLRGRFIRMWYRRTGSDVWGDSLDIKIPNATGTGDQSELSIASFIRDGVNFKTKMMNHWFGDAGGSDWRQQTGKELVAHYHTAAGSAFGQDGRYQDNNERWDRDTRLFSSGGDIVRTDVSPQTAYTGSSWGMGIQPPYYVLTWIMKL